MLVSRGLLVVMSILVMSLSVSALRVGVQYVAEVCEPSHLRCDANNTELQQCLPDGKGFQTIQTCLQNCTYNRNTGDPACREDIVPLTNKNQPLLLLALAIIGVLTYLLYKNRNNKHE